MKKEMKDNRVAGFILIGIGLLVLVSQFGILPNAGELFLPALGLIFIIWALISRTAGLLIPGGILSGIGFGVILLESPLGQSLGDGDGGLFLLGFAAGWALITLLSALFTDETYWWALIPGGVMAVVGIAVLTDGLLLSVLAFAGQAWPVILIGIGIYLLVTRNNATSSTKEEQVTKLHEG